MGPGVRSTSPLGLGCLFHSAELLGMALPYLARRSAPAWEASVARACAAVKHLLSTSVLPNRSVVAVANVSWSRPPLPGPTAAGNAHWGRPAGLRGASPASRRAGSD